MWKEVESIKDKEKLKELTIDDCRLQIAEWKDN